MTRHRNRFRVFIPETRQMPFTTEQLDNWFTYHEPTTEEEKAGYRDIADAWKRCMALLWHELDPHVFGKANQLADEGIRGAQLSNSHFQEAFDLVNRQTRMFCAVVGRVCPSSADATAAARCIRLARNALNEYIVASINVIRGGQPVFDPGHFQRMATDQLMLARWQASAAIACGGK
jgi:hypothetical protein